MFGFSSTFKDESHANPEMVNTVSLLRKANLIKAPLRITSTHEHDAHTDMSSILMSRDYMASSMPQNYHGFPTEMLGNQTLFVLQHEIGHLVIHPSQSSNWKDEIDILPVESHEKGRWANVVSDIIVNYNIGQGTPLQGVHGVERDELAARLRTAWEMILLNRSAGDYDAFKELLEDKKIEDNRYAPTEPCDVFGCPEIGKVHPRGSFDEHRKNGYLDLHPWQVASLQTPEYQRWMGYGRGPQIYPSVAYCVAHKMPPSYGGGKYPKKWRMVRLLKDLSRIQHCSFCKRYIAYNPYYGSTSRVRTRTAGNEVGSKVCPACLSVGTLTLYYGAVKKGYYEVVATKSYDDKENTTDYVPVRTYKIKYGSEEVWIPTHYTSDTCPDAPEKITAQSHWNDAISYGHVQPDGSLLTRKKAMEINSTMVRKNDMVRLLYYIQAAGVMATASQGFEGLSGPKAGYAFMDAASWDFHLAMIGE